MNPAKQTPNCCAETANDIKNDLFSVSESRTSASYASPGCPTSSTGGNIDEMNSKNCYTSQEFALALKYNIFEG